MNPHRSEPTVPAATARLKKLMGGYYGDLRRASADAGQKVAWCSSIGPVELLRALDFHVYFPEKSRGGPWRQPPGQPGPIPLGRGRRLLPGDMLLPHQAISGRTWRA